MLNNRSDSSLGLSGPQPNALPLGHKSTCIVLPLPIPQAIPDSAEVDDRQDGADYTEDEQEDSGQDRDEGDRPGGKSRVIAGRIVWKGIWRRDERGREG